MKLLESIRFETGKFSNLKFHQKRVNQAQLDLYNLENSINLEDDLCQSAEFQKVKNSNGLFKCRLVYSKQIESIQFNPYQIPTIQSLKILVDNTIDYAHKYVDRSHLQKLFAQRGNADDILIVKNGLTTDTLFANILFYNGKSWITPTKPLLNGTQRASLLEKEKIIPADIRPDDLKYFEKARLVNAMIRFEDAIDIDMKCIIQ